MKSMVHLTLVLVGLVAFSQQAQAAIAFSPTVSYLVEDRKDDNDTPPTENKSTVTVFDVRLGYIMPMGLFLGGTYAMANGSGKNLSTDTSMSGTRYGATVGIVFERFNLLGTYFLAASENRKLGTAEWKYTGGSGYQIDIGWNFMIANMIGFGPNIVYRNMNYSKRTISGVETTKNYRNNEIYPNIAFWFKF